MRPTIRGWTALAILAGLYALAFRVGPPTLNAIVAPLLVVFGVALVETVRVDRPVVHRDPVAAGAPGETRTVGIELETDGAVSATVSDVVGDGLAAVDADGSRTETTLAGTDRIDYEIRLEARGEHRLGPVTVAVTDLFGLLERRFTVAASTSVLVYPRVRELRDGPGGDLRATVASPGRARTAFDHLREYERGDSLRDVHWKSAAKRPDADLVVTEYADEAETGSATIAAECIPGRDDDLATAAASVATDVLAHDVDVALELPEASVSAGAGRDHHQELLAALAVLEPGELDERRRRDADVLVQADADGTRVRADGRTVAFDQLVVEWPNGRSDGDDASVVDRDGTGVVA